MSMSEQEARDKCLGQDQCDDCPRFEDDCDGKIDDPASEDQYDRWREDQCDELEYAFEELIKRFIYPKGRGYYKNNPNRFVRHIESMLEDFYTDYKDNEENNDKPFHRPT